MKGFRRCWVRSASLARAIIGLLRTNVQADTVRRAADSGQGGRSSSGSGLGERGKCGLDFGSIGPGRCGLLRVQTLAFE